MKSENIFDSLPSSLEIESFHTIVDHPQVKIERIVSKGHTSPEEGWFDQAHNEWVIVLQGHATLSFQTGDPVTLTRGDHIQIPAHKKHRVSWTDPHCKTIWIAVHY